jgi:hypothetical protein
MKVKLFLILALVCKFKCLYTDVKKSKGDNSLNSKMSEEEKAKVVIQKAKVEDDEYKNYTEEQTYYRYVRVE